MHRPTLPNLHKFIRPALWLGLLIIIGLTIMFVYDNWYRVVINPPPLDPAITQKRQTQILTKDYQEAEKWTTLWDSRPIPQMVPNVFDNQRSQP